MTHEQLERHVLLIEYDLHSVSTKYLLTVAPLCRFIAKNNFVSQRILFKVSSLPVMSDSQLDTNQSLLERWRHHFRLFTKYNIFHESCGMTQPTSCTMTQPSNL